MQLRDLQIGDRFISAKDKKRNPVKFKKMGKCEFNGAAGTATCKCINENERVYENKQCRLEVIQLPLTIKK